jgi:hypothetical protein
MSKRMVRFVVAMLFLCVRGGSGAWAQSPQLEESTQVMPRSVVPSREPAPAAVPVAASPVLAANEDSIVVPVGTHLPLVLRNGINTRTAKAGDVVYFETMYPISLNNRVVIPMGSFVRGELLSVKRPGRIAGRGEFRVALQQMTFLNGYTIDLRATPNSVDRDGREGVDSEGKIKGPSSKGRDVGIVLAATGGGAFIGTLAGAAINGAAGKGALIGGGAAGIGALIAILATRGPEAELPRGTTMDVMFDRPLVLSTAYLPVNTAGVDPQRFLPPPSDDAHRRREERRDRVPRFPFPLSPY